MVELVADIADGESGFLADLFVFQVLVVLELDELAVLVLELGEEEADGPRGFESGQMAVGAAGVVRRVRSFVGRFTLVVAQVIEGEIADGAVKPGLRVRDLFPVGMESQEGLLDEVFRNLPATGQAVGEA